MGTYGASTDFLFVCLFVCLFVVSVLLPTPMLPMHNPHDLTYRLFLRAEGSVGRGLRASRALSSSELQSRLAYFIHRQNH